MRVTFKVIKMMKNIYRNMYRIKILFSFWFSILPFVILFR